MYIGIIDYDIFSKKEFIPNLEVMKIARYHKRKSDIVTLVTNLQDLDKFSKIYLRKDYKDGKYPSELLLRQNLTYGGEAFTSGEYVPLSMEIEKQVPDLSIYYGYMRKNMVSPQELKKVDHYEKSSFIRLSTNGADCNLNIRKSLVGADHGYLYIYDTNAIDIKDGLENIYKYNDSWIQFVYPQYTKSLNTLCEWCNYPLILKDNFLIYNNSYYLKEFKDLADKAIDFKYPPYIYIALDPTNNYSTNFLLTDIRNSLNKAIYCGVTGARIRFLIYPSLEIKEYLTFYKYLINWSNLRFGRVSLEEYISKRSKTALKFLENIGSKNREIKELSKVAPKKIREKGGKWLL